VYCLYIGTGYAFQSLYTLPINCMPLLRSGSTTTTTCPCPQCGNVNSPLSDVYIQWLNVFHEYSGRDVPAGAYQCAFCPALQNPALVYTEGAWIEVKIQEPSGDQSSVYDQQFYLCGNQHFAVLRYYWDCLLAGADCSEEFTASDGGPLRRDVAPIPRWFVHSGQSLQVPVPPVEGWLTDFLTILTAAAYSE
jgi:hypothetical protein